jgi:hypothetical protein
MAKRVVSGLSIADAFKELENKQQATLASAEVPPPDVAPASQESATVVLLPDESADAVGQESSPVPEKPDSSAEPEHKKAAASSTTSSVGVGVDVRVVVDKIFSKEVRYKNSRNKPVIISEGYRDCIGLLSELSDCEVSQIVNNMLSLYFDNSEIKYQLNAFAKSKYKKRAEVLMK